MIELAFLYGGIAMCAGLGVGLTIMAARSERDAGAPLLIAIATLMHVIAIVLGSRL